MRKLNKKKENDWRLPQWKRSDEEMTYRQIEEKADENAACPVEYQQKEIIAGAGFKVIRFQAQRIIVQKVAIQ